MSPGSHLSPISQWQRPPRSRYGPLDLGEPQHWEAWRTRDVSQLIGLGGIAPRSRFVAGDRPGSATRIEIIWFLPANHTYPDLYPPSPPLLAFRPRLGSAGLTRLLPSPSRLYKFISSPSRLFIVATKDWLRRRPVRARKGRHASNSKSKWCGSIRFSGSGAVPAGL
jgi:hypothetical protein